MTHIDDLKTKIREIHKQCLEGALSVLETVEAIDTVIGGILRVDYKTGLKLKFSNGREMYSLDTRGVPKKLYELNEAIAVLGYKQAQRNGSHNPGEVHIGRDASTKHHMSGIERIAQRHAA